MKIVHTAQLFEKNDVAAVLRHCHELGLSIRHYDRTITTTDSSAMSIIEDFIASKEIRSLIQRQANYSENDSREAVACLVAPCVELGLISQSRADLYDIKSGCSECGTGARQVNPLNFAGRKLSKSQKACVASDDGHVVMRRNIEDRLRRIVGASEYSTMPVCENGRVLEDYVQVLPAKFLPSMEHPLSGFAISEQCPICHLNGFYHSIKAPFMPHVEIIEARFVRSIANTFECMGVSVIRPNQFQWLRIAQPLFVIGRDLLADLWSDLENCCDFTPIKCEVIRGA